jgi:hypothetical protein
MNTFTLYRFKKLITQYRRDKINKMLNCRKRYRDTTLPEPSPNLYQVSPTLVPVYDRIV